MRLGSCAVCDTTTRLRIIASDMFMCSECMRHTLHHQTLAFHDWQLWLYENIKCRRYERFRNGEPRTDTVLLP